MELMIFLADNSRQAYLLMMYIASNINIDIGARGSHGICTLSIQLVSIVGNVEVEVPPPFFGDA
jgi:hypothetical protein